MAQAPQATQTFRSTLAFRSINSSPQQLFHIGGLQDLAHGNHLFVDHNGGHGYDTVTAVFFQTESLSLALTALVRQLHLTHKVSAVI